MEEKARLVKYLSMCGVLSRRAAEKAVLSGKVKINGKTADNPFCFAGKKDKIYYLNKLVSPLQKKYIIVNKPPGLVCSCGDKHNKTVTDYLRERGVKEKLWPAGRLDKYTTGLLIVLNDGEFTNFLTSASSGVEKTYLAVLTEKIKESDIKKLNKGILINNEIHKGKFSVVSKDGRELKIILKTGKNRQIRRMLSAAGYKLKTLKRISIGGLTLKGINAGEYKDVTKEYIVKRLKTKKEGK